MLLLVSIFLFVSGIALLMLNVWVRTIVRLLEGRFIRSAART
jgi:hypothetical protein